MLKGFMYFAVFNSTKSFLHVPLDHESKQLTVMLTSIGIYLYNVLTMGLSNTTDILRSVRKIFLMDWKGWQILLMTF